MKSFYILLFHLTVTDNTLKLTSNSLCHISKAEVVGVAAVNGATVGKGTSEKALAVDVVNVVITLIKSVVEGLLNYATALLALIVTAPEGKYSVEIGTGEHNEGQVGLSFSYCLIKLLVAVNKLLAVSVVVEIGNERRHLKTCHIVEHSLLTVSSA